MASSLTSAALGELTSGLKNTKWSFLVALGAGCLVGASGESTLKMTAEQSHYNE